MANGGALDLGKESLVGNKATLQAVLWAANAVVWGCVYVIERNLKAERKEKAAHPEGTVFVDLSGEEPVEVNYVQKMIPEFTVYQV